MKKLQFTITSRWDRYCFNNQTFNPKSLVIKTVSVPTASHIISLSNH